MWKFDEKRLYLVTRYANLQVISIEAKFFLKDKSSLHFLIFFLKLTYFHFNLLSSHNVTNLRFFNSYLRFWVSKRNFADKGPISLEELRDGENICKKISQPLSYTNHEEKYLLSKFSDIMLLTIRIFYFKMTSLQH